MTIAPGHSPGKARLWLAAAAAVAGTALFVLFRAPSPPDQPAPAAPAAVAAAAEPPHAVPPPRASRVAESEPNRVAAAPTPPPARESVPGSLAPAPPREEGAQPSAPSGIGLFPPPGTDPVRVGLVVPDDFELPAGFVRHYQVTDDGQDVAPILLVHPDYELLDAAGNPVPRPPGGVVPPELAPPGMPVETVVVPEPLDESAP